MTPVWAYHIQLDKSSQKSICIGSVIEDFKSQWQICRWHLAASTVIKYGTTKVASSWLKIYSPYDSRVVNYDHKVFNRLGIAVNIGFTIQWPIL